jgi:ABC-type dipeptide/oligopeptide/nickel transport system permease component
VLVGVTALIFFVLRALPGNPVVLLTQGDPGITQAQIRHIEDNYGLNKPLLVQYGTFIWHALQGNFGVSYLTKEPVMSSIGAQAGATVELTAAAVVLTGVIGIGGGLLAAMFRDTWVDSSLRVLSLFGSAMPLFWTGVLLILVFSFTWRLFPSSGSGTFSELVLPAFSLALAGSGLLVRLVRNSMLDVMGQEFVTALRAKGLPEYQVLVRHVLRNALVPAVTVLGVQIGALLAGAVVTETVFTRQGLGSMLVQAVQNKDYPTVQALVLIIATVYVIVNILVDISYAYLDPRVRTTLTK